MVRTMQDLSVFVFVTMANLTLARRDSYMDHLKSGIKRDTLAALRSAPLHVTSLFTEAAINKVGEEISQHENRHFARGSAVGINLTPNQPGLIKTPAGGQTNRLGRTSALVVRAREAGVSQSTRPAKAQLINDNYCLKPVCSVR